MRFSLKALAKYENDDTTDAADATRATGEAIAPATAAAAARAQTAIAAIGGAGVKGAAHAGHAGARAHADRTGAIDGTHFELVIVSPAFSGKPLIARHRMIYDLLGELMRSRIHALKIDARAG